MTVQSFYDQKIPLMILAALFFIGLIIKLGVSRSYRRMIAAAEDMGRSEHRLLKNILLKFETCYKLKLSVSDVDTFVDKHIYSFKTIGAHLYSWENIGNQFLILTMVASVVGGVVGVYYDVGQFAFFSTVLGGFLLSGLLLLVDSMLNLSMKKQLLRIHIKDFLENIYRPRLENQVFHSEEMEKYRDEYFVKEKEEFTNSKQELEKLEKEVQAAFNLSKEEEEVIEEVLNEFIV